jgi:hypothetical protein
MYCICNTLEAFMKTATLPPIRVEPEFREEMESVLGEGETLSSFIENAARREAHYRKVQAEFLARGRASLTKARETGRAVPAKSVIAELDKMIDAKFGLGSARKKAGNV